MTIRLENVTKTFNQGLHNEFSAVKNVSLEIQPDRITCLTGPSGSGKTTLLSMTGCLARPTSGRIYLHDRLISNLPEHFLTEIRRRTFGFVFQRFNLIHDMTVLENVLLPAYPLGLPYRKLVDMGQHQLAALGLADKRHEKSQHLSGGEAQRVAICRALINDPEILIADEPTANLDSKLSLAFLEIIHTLNAAGKTILLTSHDPLIYQSPVIDTVIKLHDGEIDAA
jgi:putative ABC transport system ATP-binding protein